MQRGVDEVERVVGGAKRLMPVAPLTAVEVQQSVIADDFEAE